MVCLIDGTVECVGYRLDVNSRVNLSNGEDRCSVVKGIPNSGVVRVPASRSATHTLRRAAKVVTYRFFPWGTATLAEAGQMMASTGRPVPVW